MVRVASREFNNIDGSIESLRVHDILKDLAVEKAKEINFLAVCSKQVDWNLEHYRKARRVAVHYSNFNEHIQQYASSNLRSLLVFGRESNLDCSKFRLLRVLAESHTNVGIMEVQGFMGLSHLRYLQLRHPKDYWNSYNLWKSESQTLETVDCWGSPHDSFSDIWKIKTLRHVSHEALFDGPPASTNLPNLQTLKFVSACRTWRTSQLPNIFGVRELAISFDKYSLDVMAALLGKLNHLVFLSIRGPDIPIQMLKGVFRFLEKLKTLEIYNLHGEPTTLELKDNMLPPNLIKLFLYGFEFKSDPMPVLEKLVCLKFLNIRYSNKKYPLKISCSAGGFKQLEKLTLLEIELLQEWKIELGAMPMLKRLEVTKCYHLPVPQAKWFIDHKSLRHLDWMQYPKTTDLREARKSELSEIFNARPDLQSR